VFSASREITTLIVLVIVATVEKTERDRRGGLEGEKILG
jgi:hypothetical protein